MRNTEKQDNLVRAFKVLLKVHYQALVSRSSHLLCSSSHLQRFLLTTTLQKRTSRTYVAQLRFQV